MLLGFLEGRHARRAGKLAPEKRVSVWSGMDGAISSIEEDIVEISGGALPKEEAKAETEAEATR